MNYKYVGLTLFGFAAPSAVIGVAYAIGTNGTVLGTIACVVLTAASVLGSLMLLASIQLCGARVKMFGDVAKVAFGERGATWGNILQQANFFLFLPVALRLCADSAQGVIDPEFKICTNYFVFGIAMLCYTITQLRSLNNSKKFTILSLCCAVGIAVLQIVITQTHSNDDKEDVQAFGNPDGATGLGVFKAFLGVTVAAWAYVPSFLVVELWNEIPDVKEMRKGIILSGILNCVFYLGVGIPVAIAWGWDLENPITELEAWPANTAMSRVMNLLVLVANFVSYALSSIPFVRYCQLSFFPNFEVQKWSTSSVVQYALISFPSFLIAVVLAIVIPNLFVMLALMTAITVPTVTQIYPAVCFLAILNGQSVSKASVVTHTQAEMERYRGLLVDERRSDKRLGNQSHNDSLQSILEGQKATVEDEAMTRFDKPGYKRMAYVVLVIGIINFVICWLAAVGKLAYDELRGESSIGCGSWKIL